MKLLSNLLLTIILTLLIQKGKAQDNSILKAKIITLDSLFFNAYNHCDLLTQAQFYDDSIEFYHDKSGLSTSKQKLLDDTKKYVCGKVTRELVKGSIEISPIPGYGAVELGENMFHNALEPNSKAVPSKFVIIWKYHADKWTITRVISLHANAEE